MRTVGWVYLAGYALDASLSVIASYLPGFLLVSNGISMVIAAFTLVTFILACLGQLKPRRIFLVLSGYYFLVLGFGFILAILLAIHLGPRKLQGTDINPQFLRQQFPWFEPVQLTLLALWLCLVVYGFVAYTRANVDVEHGSAADPQ
jgi:hypothetical protein